MSKNKETTGTHDTFFSGIYNNIKHTLPVVFYAGLGAAASVPAGTLPNIVGSFGPVVPVAFFVANTVGKIVSISETSLSSTEKTHQYHKIEADALVNFGLSVLTYTGIALTSVASALPVLVTFIACEILLPGEHTPIDHIKSGIDGALDNMFHD